MNNEQKIWNYFKSTNLKDYAIAGLMGNLFAESGFNPKNLQNSFEKKLNLDDVSYTQGVDRKTYKNFVHDGAGYGLAQWTFWSRKEKLLQFARSKSKSIGDLDMQLEFLYGELRTSGIFTLLQNSRSLKEASNIILLKFERPADQSLKVQQKRIGYSEQIYNRQTKKTGGNKMNNSSLVSYTRISPNRGNKINGVWVSTRTHAIDTISIHCVVGQLSVETMGNIFARKEQQASCNYGVGSDGRIGLYCEEKDRSWCTSSSSNDNRAITIEVASDKTHPYAVRPVVYEALINLLVDICKRNNIKELKWKADKSLIGQVDKQNMTVHRWFANKACPGEFLYTRHGQIAAEVNARLGVASESVPTVQPQPLNNEFKVQVTVSALNYRSGPSTSYPIKGVIKDKGIYTIVAEQNGWGKLKSGAGWISLNYTKKI